MMGAGIIIVVTSMVYQIHNILRFWKVDTRSPIHKLLRFWNVDVSQVIWGHTQEITNTPFNECKREVSVNTGITGFVGIGQCASGYTSANAEMVQLTVMGAEADLDIAQAFTIGQLSKRYTGELVKMTVFLVQDIYWDILQHNDEMYALADGRKVVL